MPIIDDPALIRCGDREQLGAALLESRANTLRTFACYERSFRATALPLPYSADDQGLLYFAWLVLMHEDMHHEAAVYMANALGIPLEADRWPGALPPDPVGPGELTLEAARFQIGAAGAQFAFDNELMPHWVDVEGFRIDRAPVNTRS